MGGTGERKVGLIAFCEAWEELEEEICFGFVGGSVSNTRLGTGREEYAVFRS